MSAETIIMEPLPLTDTSVNTKELAFLDSLEKALLDNSGAYDTAIAGELEDNPSGDPARSGILLVDPKIPPDRRAAEIEEFERGDRASKVWDTLPIVEEPTEDSFTPLYKKDILEASETDPQNVKHARNEIAERLAEAGIDDNELFEIRLICSELITNIKREYPISGGEIVVGLDAWHRVILSVKGNPAPAGISYKPGEVFDDAAEHGRGLGLLDGYDESTLSRYVAARDRDGTPTAWGVVCVRETRKTRLCRIHSAMTMALTTQPPEQFPRG